MDLDDRRISMTTLAVVGALAIVAVVVFGGVTKQSPLSQ
jgi:F420-0:gamma-glutamyl ligase